MIDFLLSHSNYLLLLVMGAAIKQEIARGFTGRPSLIANTSSIFITAAPVWSTLSSWIQLWALIGIPVGILAFVSYIANFSLPQEIYWVTFAVYNTLFALLFILSFG